MRLRRGSAALEVALFVPIVVTLLVGMVQIGKITYVYYTLRKTMYTLARFVAVQQGVNFCDTADASLVAAKNFAVSGTTTDAGADPVLPGLTADMLNVAVERTDHDSATVGLCECSVTGCDSAAGGRPPD